MLDFFFFFFCFFGILNNKSWVSIYIFSSIYLFIFIPNIYCRIDGFWGVYSKLILDGLRRGLIILSLWIILIIYMSRYSLEYINNKKNLFGGVVITLVLVLIVTFSVNNYLCFYIIFEISLIPTLILIIGWGYQPERLQAGVYLIIYTIRASLPLLVGILYIYSSGGRIFINIHILNLRLTTKSRFLWLIFIMAFMVKMPIYLTHLWLPKAHVEAPVSGSMILAGILLKLGGYGLLRLRAVILAGNLNLVIIFTRISIWGAFITSLICIRQIDMKSLIAYSSVGHMGLLIGGLINNRLIGWGGRYLIILGHGFVSSGLFRIANIIYEISSSRRLYLRKGFLSVTPSLSLLFFILCCINIGAPPSINLLAEIRLLRRVLKSWRILSLLVGGIRFLAGGYSLYLYTCTQHGIFSSYLNSSLNFNRRIIGCLILHITPVIILILCADQGFSWC